MKKLLLTTAVLSVAATAAMAADAPIRHKRWIKAPVYKAMPIPYVEPVYDWSGLYIGGHVGYGELRDRYTTLDGANGLFAPGAGNRLIADQFIGGIQAGYNYRLSRNYLIGFEGEFTWLTHGASSIVPTLAATALTNTSNPDWVATAAGRLGYTSNNTLIYAKGGAAWLDSKYAAFQTPATGVPYSTSSTRLGYTVGGGLEYGFASNWSAKIEYAYLDFGTDTYNVGFGGATSATSIKTDMQQVKVGLNYRFNTFGGFSGFPVAEPIVTKY